MSEENRQLDEARVNAGSLVALIDALGADVTADDVERAALVPLLPEATAAAFNLCCAILVYSDILTAILMGACSSERIAMFANLRPSALKALARHPARPRRRRPTAAERRAAADRWLAGPAWELGPEPAPSQDGGQP